MRFPPPSAFLKNMLFTKNTLRGGKLLQEIKIFSKSKVGAVRRRFPLILCGLPEAGFMP
jgi:hypothetical protein